MKETGQKSNIINEILPIFDHISAPKQKFKNLANDFF